MITQDRLSVSYETNLCSFPSAAHFHFAMATSVSSIYITILAVGSKGNISISVSKA